jgi:transcriptional regulator with XRE-family HTH domain
MDEDAIYAAFGSAVAERRNARGQTQEQLSRMVGLSRASLANIERGRQRVFLHQILALADALELPSSHEIVPERAIKTSLPAAGISVSGAKRLTKDQKSLINNVVNSVVNAANRR